MKVKTFVLLPVICFLAACENLAIQDGSGNCCLQAEVIVPEVVPAKSLLPEGLEGRIKTITWAAYRSDTDELVSDGYDEPDTMNAYILSCILPENQSYDIFAVVNFGDCRELLPCDKHGMDGFDLMLPDDFTDMSDSGLPMAGSVPDVSPGDAGASISLRSLVSKYRIRVNLRGLALQTGSVAWMDVMQGNYLRVRHSNRHLVPFSETGSAARVPEDVADGDGDAGFSAIVPAETVLDSPEDRVFEYDLYVPENMQGVLLPDNGNPYLKSCPELERLYGAIKSELPTYLEFSLTKTAASNSNPFTGEIIYRMYLGQDNCSDFNVIGGTENVLSIEFDASSMLNPPRWKIEHGDSWNNDAEHLEFSSHDITVKPGREVSLFVWYDGTGRSLSDVTPVLMGRPDISRVQAAVRGEWYHEEDGPADCGMLSFSDLWAEDEPRRTHAAAVRFTESQVDFLYPASDRTGRYYFKSVPELIGKTAMLVVRDRWGCKRDTCYVHFSGAIEMNSSDFNDFHVAQERTLSVSGLALDADASISVTYGADCISVEPVDTSAGALARTWRIRGLGCGNAGIKVTAGGASAEFTITVLPVYLDYMYLRDGYDCPLDGTTVTDTYAYYADVDGRRELSQSSFVPELRNTLLKPLVTLEGERSQLLSTVLSDRRIIVCLDSFSKNGVSIPDSPSGALLGFVSVAPAYDPSRRASAEVRVKTYRSLGTLGKIGTLYDGSAFEPLVDSKLPGALPLEYRTHVDFGGKDSFKAYSGASLVRKSGMGNADYWSVRLFDAGGAECRSVSVDRIGDTDRWLNLDPSGQSGKTLYARLCVANRNSGEIHSEDLFSMDCKVLVCLAGAYCNEIGLYGRSSYYEVPVEDRPETFYNSVTGPSDWHDPMILIQRDEWSSFIDMGNTIRRYFILAGDVTTSLAAPLLDKSKYNLSAGLCFDTYADMLGTYSPSVSALLGGLCNTSARFITGTVENRATHVEFSTTAATSYALLKPHSSLYFSLLGYHKSKDRPVSDDRKKTELNTLTHAEGIDDTMLPLSETTPYPLRTQIQHIFYGDVEDGLCNNQPWRVDFNFRYPSSLPSWEGSSAHVPFSRDGDSSVHELISQFPPELAFSKTSNINGMTISGNNADYVCDGTGLRFFFLHQALAPFTTAVAYTWKNSY